MKPPAAFVAVFVAAMLPGARARADDGDRRRLLVESALRARDTGDHASALALAQSAGEMRPTSSLTRFIAEEHEALGHLAEAYDSAQRCLRLAEAEEPSANHSAVIVGCRSIASELRPRVALLSLTAPVPPPAGLIVRVEGTARTVGGEPFAVTPATVRIDADAPGWQPFHTSVVVDAGQEAAVTVALVRPAPEPAPALPPSPAARAGRSLLGPAIAGGGLVALATAGALHLVADRQYDDLRQACAGGCPDGSTRRSSIEQLDGVALGVGIAGAGLVVAGATIFFWPRGAATPSAGAWLTLEPTGASVRGFF
jgi:hypothetical protein